MNTQEQSIRLIQLYGEYNMLWDSKDPNHLNKTKREDCWRQISAELQCPISELKKKMDSLLGSYRREKSREKKTHITGSEAEDVYKSKWFGYHYFDFMKNKNEPGATQETMQTQPSETFNATNEDTELSIIEKGPPQALQEQHTEETSANMLIQEPARKKRRPINNPNVQTQPQVDSADIMLEQALQCLQKSSNDINDPYLSFGRHIANELRKYDAHTLAYVKNAINNIIFEADLGKYTQQQFTQGSCTQQHLQSSTLSSHIMSLSSAAASSHTITPSPASVSSHTVTPSPNANFDSEAQDMSYL